MLRKILRTLRRRLLDAPRGFGHPVPAAAFDAEFRSGHWDLLNSTDENPRYAGIIELIRQLPPRPKLLDAGCGAGRLAAWLAQENLASYQGVDLSAEAIQRATTLAPTLCRFEQADLERWIPRDRYDVIVINEVIGYFHDPVVTLRRLATALEPNGVFVISLYRWGNAPAIWKRITAHFTTLQTNVVTDNAGTKTWDICTLRPLATPDTRL